MLTFEGAMAVRLVELRERAYARLGERFEDATEESVRGLLDELSAEAHPHDPSQALELDGPLPSYEQAEREFFAAALSSADERNFVQLWLMAAELWAASLEERAGG